MYSHIISQNSFFYRNILLNYATYNPEVGYNQGMSDLLASVLAIVQDELDAFWCFVGLMEDSVFVTSPKDDVMDRQLVSSCSGSSGADPENSERRGRVPHSPLE